MREDWTKTKPLTIEPSLDLVSRKKHLMQLEELKAQRTNLHRWQFHLLAIMKETSSLVKPQERAKWGEALLRLSTRMFTLQCSNETASYTGFKRKNIKHFTFEPFCFFFVHFCLTRNSKNS